MHVVTVTQVERDGDEEAEGFEESFELPCLLFLNGSSVIGNLPDFRECKECLVTFATNNSSVPQHSVYLYVVAS